MAETTRTVPAALVPAAGADPVYISDGNFFLVHLRAGDATNAGHGSPGSAGLLALSDVQPDVALDSDEAGRQSSAESSACAIPWQADFEFEGSSGWFQDPCRGSTFTIAGVRVFGPSPVGMLALPVIVENDGAVRVDLADPIRGAENTLLTVPYPAR